MVAEHDAIALTAEISSDAIFGVPPKSPPLSANGGGGLIPSDAG